MKLRISILRKPCYQKWNLEKLFCNFIRKRYWEHHRPRKNRSSGDGRKACSWNTACTRTPARSHDLLDAIARRFSQHIRDHISVKFLQTLIVAQYNIKFTTASQPLLICKEDRRQIQFQNRRRDNNNNNNDEKRNVDTRPRLPPELCYRMHRYGIALTTIISACRKQGEYYSLS